MPPERGETTRLELPIGDGTANPYLALAATPARELPRDLAEALAALKSDTVLARRPGSRFVEVLALRCREAERFRHSVTDWELDEYSWLLRAAHPVWPQRILSEGVTVAGRPR